MPFFIVIRLILRPKDIILFDNHGPDTRYVLRSVGYDEMPEDVLSFFDLINVTNRSIIMVVILFFVISTVIYAVKFVRNIRHINS